MLEGNLGTVCSITFLDFLSAFACYGVSIFFRQCRTFGILKRYYKCKLFLFVDPCALTFCQYDGFTDGKISIFRNLFPIGIRLIFRSIFADLDRRFVLNYCLGAFIYSSIKCNRSVCSWLNICNLPCQHTCLCVIRCIFARAVVYIIKTFRNAVCNDNRRRFNFRVLIGNGIGQNLADL